MGSFDSFGQQIKAVATALRFSTAAIRVVSQVSVRLRHPRGGDAFAEARTAILRWMSKRAGRKIPDSGWSGSSFTLEEIGAQYSAAVALENPTYWAARLDDADKKIAQRSWITEIGVARLTKETALLGTRLQCATRGSETDFIPSIPGFVRQVADVMEVWLDDRPIALKPWVVATEDEVSELIEFLESPTRRNSVVVVSLPSYSTDPRETVIPIEEFQKATFGAAHTVILTGPAGFMLTDRVGKEFSVFMQSIRTYRPGLNFDEGQPFSHPLAIADRVRGWEGGPMGFTEHLVRQTLQSTVAKRDLERDLPSFTTVRRLGDERQREKAKAEGAETSELLDLALDENARLQADVKRQSDDYESLIDQVSQENTSLQNAKDELHAQIHSLRARIAYLEARVAEPGRIEEALPKSFDALADWAVEHLSGRVVVHNRAIRAARKSNFENVELAYRALLVLRDHYVPMKREGGIERKRAYEGACANLGLEESASFAGNRYGEEGDAYQIEYGGKRRLLDRHLKGSNSRDPRYGFRLYFFWDENDQQVVVGSLPSHLPTRIS